MKWLNMVTGLHQRRLEQEERKLVAAQAHLASSQAEQARCQQVLDEFLESLSERVENLYASLLNRVVEREDIVRVKAAVQALYLQRDELGHALQQAVEAVREAVQRLEQARQTHAQQLRRTEKFDEVATQFRAAALQMELSTEEQEIEELWRQT